MTGANLFWLLERVIAVVKICVLKDLGFDDEKVQQIVANNPQMTHLKMIKVPWENANDE